MSLLIKAAKDAGLNADFYTYYAGGLGALPAMGESALGHVKQITEWHGDDPKAVAYALEGMRFDTPTGEVEMRKQDPQLIQPLYLSTVQTRP
jgi:branched-chain amino acid transport system substrate-binding protein